MDINVLLIQSIGALTFIIIIELILMPPISSKIKCMLYIYVFFCGIVLAKHLNQSGTPILLIGCSLMIALSRSASRLWNMLLFQVAWFWSVITDYAVTIPLHFLGYEFDDIRSSFILSAIFIFLHALLAIIPSYFIGRWLRRRFREIQGGISSRVQRLLLGETSICSCIYLLNIIAGSFVNYPEEILLFNGLLIFCFTISNSLLFVTLYQTFQENKRLALKMQEQEKLAEYTEQLESHYQEMRRFKHDYVNLLATMNGFIQDNDMAQLKDYFEEHIAPGSNLLLTNDAIIARLSNIKVLEIKGLLYTKLIQAMNLNLRISLELTDEITAINMDLLILSRVLGIYLDNAIEAASVTDEHFLGIALVRKDLQIIFHIENSAPSPEFPLERLNTPGVTTKENHGGLGLSIAGELLSPLPNVLTQMTYDKGHMSQVLLIQD